MQKAMRDLTKKGGQLWDYYDGILEKDSGTNNLPKPPMLMILPITFARSKGCQCRFINMSQWFRSSSSTQMQTSGLGRIYCFGFRSSLHEST